MDRTKYGCTTYIDDKSLQVWHKYRYIIYMSYGGRESNRYESRAGGGGKERQRLYAAE